VKLRNIERILFLSVVISFVGFLCFAQEASAPSITSNSTASVPFKTGTFIGKVDSVSSWNEREKPRIVVRDDKGIQSTFMVEADTVIIGTDGNPTTLNWIEGNKVAIEYTENQESIKTAKSIKVLTEM
jgi:hypothetical protein